MFSWFGFLRRKRHEQELDAEINAHLAMETQLRMERGEAPGEAEANARKDLGNVALIKEVTRESWGPGVWLDSAVADLRFALRTIARRPSFALLAVLTTALGIGAATATFSMLDTVLLRPLPYKNPERLVSVMGTVPIWRDDPTMGFLWNTFGLTYAQYEELGKRKRLFDELAIYGRRYGSLLGADEPRRVRVGIASAKFFSVLGLQPLQGRSFQPEDEDATSTATAILSHELWLKAYGGNPDILGQTIMQGEVGQETHAHTVIGILPADFEFASYGIDAQATPELWIPIRPNAPGFDRNDDFDFEVIGALAPTASITEAEQETGQVLNALLSGDAKAFFKEMGGRIVLRQEQETQSTHVLLVILFGASALLLVIACGNVANLLLGQAAAREQEMALRSSIGATRFRIARQLVTESLLLSLTGGAIGAVMASWGIRGLLRLAPAELPRATQIGLDPRVLLFAVGVSLLTGLFFGLAPVFTLFRSDLNSSLKDGGHRRQTRHSRMQSIVIIGEISLSFVLLVGAGLLSQSFFRLTAMPIGFRTDNLLSLGIHLPEYRYPDEAATKVFYDTARERLSVLPDVEATTTIDETPFDGGSVGTVDEIEGFTLDPGEPAPFLHHRAVFPNYFEVVGARLVAGRTFTEAERTDNARVMIVNRTLAERFWPGQDPLNKRIRTGDWFSIVGVTEDLREVPLAFGDDIPPTFYVPASSGNIILRTSGDPLRLAPLVREQIRSIDPDLPIDRIESVSNLRAATTAVDRYRTILVAAFALAAVSLALIGLYGVISRLVLYRTHELGVRVALGATPSNVLQLILRKCLFLCLAGVGLGMVAALAATRVLSGYLFGIGAMDAMTCSAIAAGLVCVSILAGYIPARRAARIDPVECLRGH